MKLLVPLLCMTSHRIQCPEKEMFNGFDKTRCEILNTSFHCIYDLSMKICQVCFSAIAVPKMIQFFMLS